MNRQVEVTRRTLRTISHYRMVHSRVLEAYIHFSFMYATDHIFPVLPIKDLINEDDDPTTPFKLATGTENSVSNVCVLFCPCVVRKATAHIDRKGFSRYLRCNCTASKWYIVYVPSTRKIISSYDTFLNEIFSSTLAYTSQPYSEAMAMSLAVSYIPCDTYSGEKTGNIIMFAQFEEGNLLSENCDDAESGE